MVAEMRKILLKGSSKRRELVLREGWHLICSS